MAEKEQTSTDRNSNTDDKDAIRCAACDHQITERAYQIEKSGAHAHTFVNPHGFVYQVGCYVAAPGCIQNGDPQTAFSWFPGWTWQVVSCARCHTHLGWIYRCAGDQFHGLITTKLRM